MATFREEHVRSGRSPKRWIVLGLVLIAIIAAVVLVLVYAGGGGSSGGGGY